MVSTRGLKTKFYEGEKVLCYEPDPTKAKVLYESKVKDVVTNKSKKSVEYLIHFRGWNSSWDRCVNEEYILKDTPENRQLQKDLAEKSKLQFGAYLYRKDKEGKKHSRKNSTTFSSASEDANRDTDSPVDHEDDRARHSSSSEDDSSTDEGPIALELTGELRRALELDFYMVTTCKKLHRIPAEPNVVTILELYWRCYASGQLCQLHDKGAGGGGGAGRGKAHAGTAAKEKMGPEEIKRNLHISQEVLDGIRIYFDFTLQDLLLYNQEVGQIETGQAIALPQHKVKSEKIKEEPEDQEYAHLPSIEDEHCADDENHSYNNDGAAVGRRRSLRSYRSLDTKLAPLNININRTESEHSSNSSERSTQKTHNSIPDLQSIKISSWRALPDYTYLQRPPPPSLLYGATHLARLFVKLPELLGATNMSDEKLKVLLGHLELFIEFLSEHKEWFLDKCYLQ